jgi:hypothetical protein
MKSGRWKRGIYFHKANQSSVLCRPFMLAAADSVPGMCFNIDGHTVQPRLASYLEAMLPTPGLHNGFGPVNFLHKQKYY